MRVHKEVLIFAACYSGDMKEGEKATKALRGPGRPIADVISPHSFIAWQAAFDPRLMPGARNYWKSHDFTDLPDDAIKVIVDAVCTLPSPECEVFIAHVGGAMARVAPNTTAWSNRNAHFIMNARTSWRDKAQNAACVAWARQLFEATAPFASGSVYVNFMPEDENDRVANAYGANYLRLAEIKCRYDPQNSSTQLYSSRPHVPGVKAFVLTPKTIAASNKNYLGRAARLYANPSEGGRVSLRPERKR